MQCKYFETDEIIEFVITPHNTIIFSDGTESDQPLYLVKSNDTRGIMLQTINESFWTNGENVFSSVVYNQDNGTHPWF